MSLDGPRGRTNIPWQPTNFDERTRSKQFPGSQPHGKFMSIQLPIILSEILIFFLLWIG